MLYEASTALDFCKIPQLVLNFSCLSLYYLTELPLPSLSLFEYFLPVPNPVRPNHLFSLLREIHHHSQPKSLTLCIT